MCGVGCILKGVRIEGRGSDFRGKVVVENLGVFILGIGLV